MQDNTEQHLDKLTKKIITKSSLESPSLDFTEHLMSKIERISNDSIVYKPLISKRGWLIIAILFIGGLSYTIFESNIQSLGWFESVNLDYSILTDNKITEALTGFTISNIAMYAIVFFGLLFFVQFSFLKNYHSKQFNY